MLIGDELNECKTAVIVIKTSSALLGVTAAEWEAVASA